MQITGQNQQPVNPQCNVASNCASVPVAPVQSPPVMQNVSYNPAYYPPQITTSPGATGVNIQIFNPSVTPAGGAAPTYNVNAPNYYPAGAYPSNYYTTQMGQCTCPNCANSKNEANNAQSSKDANQSGTNNAQSSKNVEQSGTNNSLSRQTNSNSSQNISENVSSTDEKTVKKRIVLLNDNYIKNLENMLNSQDKSQRVTAAKAVFERLDEDPSRKDDKALTALINKMLQDPVQEVRLLALSALEGRICNGDDYTVALLQQMQTNPQGPGFDASDASRILLDMSAQKVDKQVPVDPDKLTKIKNEEKKNNKK